MNTELNRVNTTGSEEASSSNEFEKFKSLIATLKGQEEYLLDDTGIIISTNLEAVNVTGYEEYEVIGKHFSIFYPLEEKWRVEEDLKKAIIQNSIVVTGLRLKKKGSTFWAKMKIKYTAEDLNRSFFKVTLQDTTHRALSNIRMQAFRDEFLTIFNNPFVGTFKYRKKDSRILRCNQKSLDITGVKNSTNLLFSNFFSCPSQFEQFNSLLDQNKKIEGFQFLINDKTSSGNWGLISAHYFESQGLVGGVLLDISEQFNQMNELQRVNSELENFTYHASHDLRAPLTSIMGLANLGLKEESIETLQGYFKMIRERTMHLDNLLKDLVSISYNNKTDVKNTLFSFQDEVDFIINELRTPYNEFDIETDIVQQNEFLTDPIRLRTILRNLFSNSFKYFNPDKVKSYLKIKIRVGLTHASIQLQDNGIGIDRQYKEKVFDMFFRGTTQSTGSGLGLYIVKSMLTKLDGKISMESTVLAGTTFLLTIPNAKMKIMSSDN